MNLTATITIDIAPRTGTPDDNDTYASALSAFEGAGVVAKIEALIAAEIAANQALHGFEAVIRQPELEDL